MKAKAIIRRILGIGITAATMITVLGALPAFARPADPDPKTPVVAPAAPLPDVSSGRAWIIPLIIGGVLVLAAALIGAMRFQRSGQLATDV